MSVISLLNVDVKNNPASFSDPYEFEITFECLEPLSKDLEWKLIYVGSATSSEHDQELDSLLVGPIPVGVNKFVFEASPPDLKKIPDSEIIGVTVILLTCSYDGREFVRVGYYVNNEYAEEALQTEPPAKPIIEKVRRSILAEKPRVTRFAIKWDSEESAPPEFPPDQPEADLAEDDSAAYGAEEVEEEVEDEEAAPELAEASATANGEDTEMAGAEDVKDGEDNASEAGSEDLEAESSGSDDEDEEDEEEIEEGEGADGDEKMDTTGGDGETEAQHVGSQAPGGAHPPAAAQGGDVMVH